VEVERADGIFIEGGDFNIQQITGLEAGAFEDGLLNLLVGHVAAVFHIDHVLLWLAGCYGEEQQQDTEEIGMFFHQKVNSRKGRKKNGLGKGEGCGVRGAGCGLRVAGCGLRVARWSVVSSGWSEVGGEEWGVGEWLRVAGLRVAGCGVRVFKGALPLRGLLRRTMCSSQ